MPSHRSSHRLLPALLYRTAPCHCRVSYPGETVALSPLYLHSLLRLSLSQGSPFRFRQTTDPRFKLCVSTVPHLPVQERSVIGIMIQYISRFRVSVDGHCMFSRPVALAECAHLRRQIGFWRRETLMRFWRTLCVLGNCVVRPGCIFLRWSEVYVGVDCPTLKSEMDI